MYFAVVFKFRKCPKCNELEDGLFSRLDCGCVWEEEVGKYPTLNAARMAAIAKSRKKGTWKGGRSTGYWSVDTHEDGTVEFGNTKQLQGEPK